MFRLILLVVLLLVSFLCVFRAPQLHLWYLAILASEFSWVFFLVTAILTAMSAATDKYRMASMVIGALTCVIFAIPVIGAYNISQKLDTQIKTVFGNRYHPTDKEKPFTISKMFTGINASPVEYKTFVYCDHGLQLDFYQAQTKGYKPCVIVIHGGSWAGGDNKQLPELNWQLAKDGYNVAAIRYRLAPESHSPAPVEDVHAAINYLKLHAGELNIDTNNFVLLGRSAGGQIAMIAAYTFHDPCIKGVINYYGPADMVWGYHNPASLLVYNSCKVMEDYLGGTYQQLPKQYVSSSPIEMVTKDAVPTLTIHGEIDALVAYGHSTRLDKKLKQIGVKHLFLSLPFATHGCDYTLNGPSGQLATYTVERFLNMVTRKGL